VLAYPPSLFFEPTLRNYRDAMTGNLSIASSFVTSVILATATTILTILIAVPAAYAFARLRLPARQGLGFYTLVTQMIPPVGLVIPYYLILNRVGMLDTYQGLITVYLTFSLPFAIWLMVSYLEDIPREMEEAAFLDKASRLQALWHVILPQVRGGIGVATVFVFLNAWNEFLFAIQIGGKTIRPVTVAMHNFVQIEQTLWAKLAAAALIAMLPVIVIGILAQRQIVKGLTVGAVKGGSRR
jgi:ABC-type glycerol-3-phosphate transport system permease component